MHNRSDAGAHAEMCGDFNTGHNRSEFKLQSHILYFSFCASQVYNIQGATQKFLDKLF